MRLLSRAGERAARFESHGLAADSRGDWIRIVGSLKIGYEESTVQAHESEGTRESRAQQGAAANSHQPVSLPLLWKLQRRRCSRIAAAGGCS